MLCECGCGLDAGLYLNTIKGRSVKGQPKRFLLNHEKVNRGVCKNGHPRTANNILSAGRCKPCAREVSKQWQKDHPKAYRFTVLKHKYGITEEQYTAMLVKQQNACVLCGSTFIEVPRVDHDHETGKVRELLCGICNSGLGYFKDNIQTLENAIAYLRKHKETQWIRRNT